MVDSPEIGSLMAERKLPFSIGVCMGRARLTPFLSVMINTMSYCSPLGYFISVWFNVKLHPCSFIQPSFKQDGEWLKFISLIFF